MGINKTGKITCLRTDRMLLFSKICIHVGKRKDFSAENNINT